MKCRIMPEIAGKRKNGMEKEKYRDRKRKSARPVFDNPDIMPKFESDQMI